MEFVHRRIAMATGALVVATLAATSLTASAAELPPEPPTFRDVAVHDPSVVTSGDDVWVFGSHGASAHTTDLISWTQNTRDIAQNRSDTLFDDIDTELAETFAWAESNTLWATDVIELPDGRFYMYYNACRGDSPRSVMGVAVADSVDGPYEDLGIILRSGQRAGEPQQIPGQNYNGTVDPNVVDPDVFFDADGKLWMVYGSYSGGIFILEMDETTGMPIAGQGWGKHLIGGDHARIEGPSIRYDASTDYYYMFLSFGGLDLDGGYDMRVMRSSNPDGPYVDADGHDMSTVKGAPGSVFDDASIQPYGVKLLGGHRWLNDVSNPGAGLGAGYISPGHNSWYDDPETGQSYLIFHSRFPNRGNAHSVRVHQMGMNEAGWPVVSPLRYGGETAGATSVHNVPGKWQLINMGKNITATAATPKVVEFGADGSVEGDLEGTWTLTADSTAALTLGGEQYSGLFTTAWDPDLRDWAIGLTVQNSHGVSIVGRGEVLTPVVTSALESAIADAGVVDRAAFTAGSLADLDAAVVAGEAVLADDEATQGEVDAAATAVTDAITGLVEIVVPPVVTYIDVNEDSKFFAEISWLTAEGISTGWSTPAGREYRPFDTINRDAMAAFLYRSAGSPQVQLPATSPFSDITPQTKFYKEMVWMYQEDISRGWYSSGGDRTYRPLQPITREAIAAFLYRAAGKPGWTAPSASPFKDLKKTDNFYKEITWLADADITTGWSVTGGKEFRPDNLTRRDAMAAFLYRYHLHVN